MNKWIVIAIVVVILLGVGYYFMSGDDGASQAGTNTQTGSESTGDASAGALIDDSITPEEEEIDVGDVI